MHLSSYSLARVWGRFLTVALVLVLALCAISAGSASAQSKYASIVIDAGNGEVLYRANADDPKYPASLTKMMTLYLTFEALQKKRIKLGQYFPDFPQGGIPAADQAGPQGRPEDQDRARDPGACHQVGQRRGHGAGGGYRRIGNPLRQMMNQKARRLGMMRTTFRNPSGLPDDDQVTTARDLATLANALIRDYPKYYPYFSRASFTYQGIEHPNHNRLMEIYQGMDGLKTGYIRASGFNLAASAVRDGRRLIAVVMGGDTPGWRDEHMAELMDQGFATPRTPAPLVASLRPPAVPARKPETGIDVASLEEVVGQQQTGGIGRFGNSRLHRPDQQRRGGGTPEEREAGASRWEPSATPMPAGGRSTPYRAACRRCWRRHTLRWCRSRPGPAVCSAPA